MKHYILARKDIRDVRRGVVVHGCNCSNGFGSGVALAVKQTWPIVERRYRELFVEEDGTPCSLPRKDLLGSIQIVEIEEDLLIVNGFTQLKYGRDKKRYADPLAIQSVLNFTLVVAEKTGHGLDIYMPKIGCHLGGLNWEKDVEPLVQTTGYKAELDGIRIVVCDPNLPVYLNEVSNYRG